MFFVISKIISSFTDPFFLSIVLFIIAIVLKNMKYKKRFALASMLVITLFGNCWLGNACFSAWEKSYKIPPHEQHYRFGVVLGGFATYQSENNKQVYFNECSDRLLVAIQQYKLGKIDKIVITGGEGRVLTLNQREADISANYLYSIGIPKKDVLLENQSKNTHENAVNSAQLLLPQMKTGEKILLITSAFHIKRSVGCFQNEGFAVDALPTDYYTYDDNDWTNIFTIKLVAINQWRVLIHEMMGYFIYDIIGYL